MGVTQGALLVVVLRHLAREVFEKRAGLFEPRKVKVFRFGAADDVTDGPVSIDGPVTYRSVVGWPMVR